MKSPTVSIIVPIYGVEKYIAKCIDSIKQQVFTDFEVLLINDGTKDNSVAVAKQAINGDRRFVFLHKENGGQGSARNLGLDKARGKYISFIDSDDYVEPNFLQSMYKKIVEEGAEICTCDVKIISPDGNLEKEFINNPDRYISSKDYLNVYFYISNWIWDKLFKKEVFENIRFDPMVRTFEDTHLIFRLIYKKRLTSTREFLYNYVQHKESTSNAVKPSYLHDRIEVYRRQIKFANKNDINNEYYLIQLYLKTFVFFCVVTFARYSTDYRADIRKLTKEIDYKQYTFKNILFMIKQERRVGLSLLLFKLSPTVFRGFTRVWFRKKSA